MVSGEPPSRPSRSVSTVGQRTQCNCECVECVGNGQSCKEVQLSRPNPEDRVQTDSVAADLEYCHKAFDHRVQRRRIDI